MYDLRQRLDGGEVIVLDGAMGTKLERRGVPMDDAAWSAVALFTHPDTVREVHEDYVRAGADVITTNTFATARHVLEPAGMGEWLREFSARAVALAKEARAAANRPVSIAGSISTFTARYDYSYEPRAEKAGANYREQAEVLAESGVDELVLEMIATSSRRLMPWRPPRPRDCPSGSASAARPQAKAQSSSGMVGTRWPRRWRGCHSRASPWYR